MDGSAVDRDHRIRRAVRRGIGAPGGLAILADVAAGWTYRAVSQLVVFQTVDRSGISADLRRGVRRAVEPDCRLREDAGRRRRPDPEVLDASRSRLTEKTAQEAREGSAHPLARHEIAVEELAD